MPLKPDRPIATLVFSKSGKVRPNVERLPREQKDLEIAVGEKFRRAMQHFRNECLIDIRSVENQADFVCRDALGRSVKVQVVEVVDAIDARVLERRASYRHALETNFSRSLRKLAGCRLTLINGSSDPLLPSTRTRQGRQCIIELSDFLDALANEIHTLDTRKRRVRRLMLSNVQAELFICCERFAPPDSGLAYQLIWGGGKAVPPGDERRLLTQAVSKKIERGYSRPEQSFWLLAYSTDTLLCDGNPDLVSAAELLSRHRHPFDVVWYFFPHPNRKNGHLVELWRRGEAKQDQQRIER